MPTVPLDDAQQAAVDHDTGPCLVIAGPGSGKTRVIVERFLALCDRGIAPTEQLVLAYNNKAATEMRERVETVRGAFPDESPLATYHAFAGRVVREWGWLIGIAPTFHIADDAERWLHVEAVLSELQPHTLWNPLRPLDRIDDLLRLIQSAKQELVTPADYAQWAAQRIELCTDDADRTLLERHAECAAVFAHLDRRYKQHAVLDYDDCILYAEQLIRAYPAARRAIAGGIRYIMVDEYQDTNFAQARLVETLASDHYNVMVVADDDQAIYKFRGASRANLDRFARTYPEHKKIILQRNYRSTPQIVASSRAIMNAATPETRIDKTLVAHRDSGNKVELWYAETEQAEMRAVARACADAIESGMAPNNIAWLFRRHDGVTAAAHALQEAGLPYTIHGGRGFFQNPEIKALLALLMAVADPTNSQALLRCLHLPAWKVSAPGRRALLQACTDHDLPLENLIRTGAVADLTDADQSGARLCVENILSLHDRTTVDDVRDIFFNALETSHFLSILDDIDDAARAQAGANLGKFGEILDAFADWNNDRRIETALHYLDVLGKSGAADRIANVDVTEDGIALLTAHSAKGLEWPMVFISACIESRWPGRPGFAAQLTLPEELIPETPPPGDGLIDEERRLFYVGTTRAQDRLILTYANRYAHSYMNERPSPFLRALGSTDSVAQTVRIPSSPPTYRQKRRSVPPRDSGRLRASISDIRAYKECPRQFEYRKRYHMPTPYSLQSWYGTLIHGVLHTAAIQRRSGSHIGEEEIATLWAFAWEQTPGKKGAHADLRAYGEAQLRRYISSAGWRDATIMATEESFALALNTLDLVGRFDRVDAPTDAPPTVVDYKTGTPRSAEQLGRDIQVRGYAVALSQREHTDAVNVELHHLQTTEIVRIPFDKAALDRAYAHLSASSHELTDAWASKDFPPKPSQWRCRSCAYRTICDEGKAELAHSNVETIPVERESSPTAV